MPTQKKDFYTKIEDATEAEKFLFYKELYFSKVTFS